MFTLMGNVHRFPIDSIMCSGNAVGERAQSVRGRSEGARWPHWWLCSNWRRHGRRAVDRYTDEVPMEIHVRMRDGYGFDVVQQTYQTNVSCVELHKILLKQYWLDRTFFYQSIKICLCGWTFFYRLIKNVNIKHFLSIYKKCSQRKTNFYQSIKNVILHLPIFIDW